MSKVLLFLADGFEEIEALTVVDVLRRADIKCDMCSIKDEFVDGTHGIKVKADLNLNGVKTEEYDAVVLPGGMPGAENLRQNKSVIETVKKFNEDKKIVAAICAAPIVLNEAGIIKNKVITSYPDFKDKLTCKKYVEEKVFEDGNIITSRGPATAIYFALKLVEKIDCLKTSEKIKSEMLLNFVENEL
ncbi:MAG: DJ-1/PfpI family protein [Clostridium sp.]|nr:DJ-1/PfpI family protein [Clostridium sp.]